MPLKKKKSQPWKRKKSIASSLTNLWFIMDGHITSTITCIFYVNFYALIFDINFS